MSNQPRIPLMDIKKQYQALEKELKAAIDNVLTSQQFIGGPQTEKLEEKFAKWCGHKYAVALGSGTDALCVALKLTDIKPGDEVVIPAFTFIATAEVVTLLGAKVVFCDVNPDTGLIDIADLKKKISSKTRAVIPVHLYGQIAPMPEIMKLARKYTFSVIEDAAQAHGATFKGKMAPIGQVATYSFYPAKNLGAFGDAGALVTNSRSVYRKAIMFRNHGQKPGQKYLHYNLGYNCRMDEIQAAVLNVKLPRLKSWVKKRQKLARFYDRLLADIPQVKPLTILPENTHAYHLYTVRTKKRDKLMAYLEKQAIQTRVHYPRPLHLQPAYKFLEYKRGDFPGSEALAKSLLCLPLYPEMTKKQVHVVCQRISRFFDVSQT